jgi:tripartite-type tricarboxylate transporter receptor subunit TctC
LTAAAVMLGCMPTIARAAWPDRPIRLVVPYQPGGGSDLVARIVAAKAQEFLGQPVVVENRSGANGTIAGRFVATSAPDGYTLLIDSVSIAQNASLFRNPPFKAGEDLLPIAQLVEFPFVVAMNKQVPARDVAGLVALAKQRPGALNVAESGASPRLVAELFRLTAGVQFTFVPYRGSAPSVSALLSGEVDLFFSDLPSIAQYVGDPASAVTAVAMTGRQRSALIPNVPTAREVGMPRFETLSWYGVFAPRALPMEIAQSLNQALNLALQTEEVKARLAQLSCDPANLSQAEFAAFFQKELIQWREVIRAADMPMVD